jgi:RimJ/RimL family protein N-acetyltransferase
MDLKFTPFRPTDLAEYTTWFPDGGISRGVSNPDALWMALVMGEAGAWAVRDAEGAFVAVVEAEPHGDSRCYVSVTVAPERRGQGIGADAIRRFHAGPGAQYRVLEGKVAPDHAASVAMAKKAGFVLTSPEPDSDGMLRFELRRVR